ncbi:hypothetical protein LUZ60_016358 [Juncus effusus]|nr:hypothetical protein LUZ60_016358 [Juncus effusus]
MKVDLVKVTVAPFKIRIEFLSSPLFRILLPLSSIPLHFSRLKISGFLEGYIRDLVKMLLGRIFGGNSFEQTYRCYPASFIDKPNLEIGDKVIMPPSALDRLASLHIEYPMLFEIHNDATQRVSHCGVLEFIAEEGMIYMPYWMMQNMLLREGDIIRLKNASLPKGTYVKLQPHTTDFLDISNPKAILETTLRNFSCLTTGDSISISYNNKQYYIDIVETKPSNAISIIETDCEVDFAPPLDYKEPQKIKNPNSLIKTPPQDKKVEDPEKDLNKFIPFTGGGKRLDGKPAKAIVPDPKPDLDPLVGSKRKQQNTTSSISQSNSGGPARNKPAGKLVFGSSSSNSNNTKETQEVSEKESKKEEGKLKVFGGKSYSLKG